MAWFDVSTILVPLLTLLIGVSRWKNIQQYRYLFLFVACGMLTQLMMFILRKLRFGNTMFLGHIYVLVAFVLLSLFYGGVLKGYLKSYWFKGLIIFFFVLCVSQLLFFQSINEYPNIQFAMLSIVMVLYSLIYFHKVMVEARVQNLKKEAMIWFNVAVLFYYTGALFHFILFNMMLDYSHEILIKFTDIMVGINAMLYIFIGIGFWIAKK